MKVGDYVRTNEFGIQKVKWFDNEEPILENGFTALQSSGYKSSPNIIDLIEVGDYVNGKLVEDIFDKTNYADKSIKLKGSGDYWYNEHIKSIVTKEQFESMEYKVKE
jgi:hypothetical protein